MVNAVLALGCRATPKESEEQMSGLFDNVLSLLSNVILGISNISKVQTLTLMVSHIATALNRSVVFIFFSICFSLIPPLLIGVIPSSLVPPERAMR